MTDSLPRVLIVDDEADNLSALKRLLRKDFEVFTSENGPNALKIIEEETLPMDVIISDQRMPGMTGSEFFERVQKLDLSATRILISGFSDLEAVIDAVNRGHIWQYIAKPWEPEELKKTLRYAAERTFLKRRVEESRIQLTRAATELRAKDWARERLLLILLHEFRNMPQIVDSVIQLNSEVEATDTRASFLQQLQKRFTHLSQDIESLMKEEKEVSMKAKEKLSIKKLAEELSAHFQLKLEADPSQELFPYLASEEIIRPAMSHLIEVLIQNSQTIKPEILLESPLSKNGGFFLTLRLQGQGQKPLPTGLQKEKLEAQTAWTALLEPFVGHQNWEHHQGGLRVDTARIIRQLAAQGIRADFDFSSPEHSVNLILHFE